MFSHIIFVFYITNKRVWMLQCLGTWPSTFGTWVRFPGPLIISYYFSKSYFVQHYKRWTPWAFQIQAAKCHQRRSKGQKVRDTMVWSQRTCRQPKKSSRPCSNGPESQSNTPHFSPHPLGFYSSFYFILTFSSFFIYLLYFILFLLTN